MRGRVAISLFLLAGLAGAAASERTKIVSEKLAEGIWAAPTPGGANVGWFAVGGFVIAVDAGVNEDVGRALIEEIQKTSGQKPRYLVVTHSHRDHAGGAASFAAAGAQILCAEKAAPGVLAVLDAASRGASVKPGSAKAAFRPVVMTISERSLVVGNEPRRAEIDYLGPGHTQGDLVVLLATDGVLFSGDLAVNGVLPYVRSADVDPKGWQRSLQRLAAVKVDKLVPGHGKIGSTEGIADTAAYLRILEEIATKFVLGNVPESLYEAQLHAPENTIQNVPVTTEHVANVKAVAQLERASRQGTPTPSAPGARPTPTPRTP
jgi:cyclase